MSKHKIRYILPLLAVMASAACVGAACIRRIWNRGR